MRTFNMTGKNISLGEWKKYYLSIIKQMGHDIERVKFARDRISNQIKLLESLYTGEGRDTFTEELENEARRNRMAKCVECSALNSIIRDMEKKN